MQHSQVDQDSMAGIGAHTNPKPNFMSLYAYIYVISLSQISAAYKFMGVGSSNKAWAAQEEKH